MDLKDHIQELAAEYVGNWKSFKSFGWHDEPEDADDWCLIYTHNRNSKLLDLSNAAQIAEALKCQ